MRKNDESRQFLDASLGIDLSDNLNLKVAYSMTGHTGDYTTTFSPFLEGGEEIILDPVKKTTDASFGGYARGNIYWLSSPKNDATNEFSLQATLKMDNTSATIGGGLRTFKQDYTPTPVNDTSSTYFTALGTPNWAGIVPFPNSALKLNNPLTHYIWEDNQKSTTPFAFLEAVTHPIDALSITANFRWENTKLDGTVNGNLLGLMARAAPVPAGGVATRFVADTTTGVETNKLGSIMASLTAAVHLTDELSLTALYRMTSTHVESDGLLTSSLGATDSASGTDVPGNLLFKSKFSNQEEHVVVDNKTTTNLIEAFANWAPMSTFNVRAGVQIAMRTPVYKRTAEDAADSGSDAFLSRDSKTLTPFGSFWVRPWKGIKLSGRYSHADMKFYASGTSTEMDVPIRIDPEKQDKYSATLELTPTDDLRATMRYQGMKGTSTFVGMIAAAEPPTIAFNPMLNTGMNSLSGNIMYNASKKTAISLSAEYRLNDFSVPFTWTRGQNLPVALRVFGDSLTMTAEQHTKDIYFDASMTLNPIESVHLLFGGTMTNSVGGTYLPPEVATATAAQDVERMGGSYDYYTAHTQVGYDITKNIGVQLDYQYVVLHEEKIANFTGVLNNFKASLFRASLGLKL
jgi:hypothetical protein